MSPARFSSFAPGNRLRPERSGRSMRQGGPGATAPTIPTPRLSARVVAMAWPLVHAGKRAGPDGFRSLRSRPPDPRSRPGPSLLNTPAAAAQPVPLDGSETTKPKTQAAADVTQPERREAGSARTASSKERRRPPGRTRFRAQPGVPGSEVRVLVPACPDPGRRLRSRGRFGEARGVSRSQAAGLACFCSGELRAESA
jgi:hypothetical protein